MVHSYLLCGIENPLLDVSAVVEPTFLTKYKLKANDAILADASHKELFTELVRDHKVSYNAAGAAQNTMRGAQWMLPANSTVYLGCVGNDKNAAILRDAAKKDGLDTLYLVDQEVPTGEWYLQLTSAVLITDNNRSMVTDLLAANNYKISHLESADVWETVTAAKNYYVGGYFLTVSPPSALKIAKHAAEHNKVFSFNISAPFIPQFFKDPLAEVLSYSDIVFCNETEAQSWADNNGFKGTLQEIALKLASLPKVNAARERVVIFTQGAQPTIVAQGGKTSEFPVIPIDKKDIVDTTGAGDAFVGGFMSQYCIGNKIDRCVAGGNYCANVVIQRNGPSYPAEKSSFE